MSLNKLITFYFYNKRICHNKELCLKMNNAPFLEKGLKTIISQKYFDIIFNEKMAKTAI